MARLPLLCWGNKPGSVLAAPPSAGRRLRPWHSSALLRCPMPADPKATAAPMDSASHEDAVGDGIVGKATLYGLAACGLARASLARIFR